jgi:hypothetical protein
MAIDEGAWEFGHCEACPNTLKQVVKGWRAKDRSGICSYRLSGEGARRQLQQGGGISVDGP